MKRGAEEEYVRRVRERLPRVLPGRGQIETDLRMHLADLVEAEGSVEAAIERMGPPGEVAAELLAQVPLEPTSHGRRLAAFLVDTVVLTLILLPPSLLARPWLRDLPLEMIIVPVSLVAGAITLAYFGLLEGMYGQTVGKRVVGVCVVRDDGSRAGWWAVLIRRIPFVGNFFPLDALFVFFTERRQRAFDKVAGTVVIDCR